MPTKNWDGQNANHNQKSGQNANLWLAFRPVGILSGWHFVLPPQQRSAHTIDQEMKSLQKADLRYCLYIMIIGKHWIELEDQVAIATAIMQCQVLL